MPTQNPEQERRNLDQRLRAAIEPLATKAELRAAIDQRVLRLEVAQPRPPGR